MYRPKQGSYHQFLTVYNECIAKGMQHEEIAYKLDMPMLQYWHLHAQAELSEVNMGRFIQSPVYLTNKDKAKKARIAEMTKLLNSP